MNNLAFPLMMGLVLGKTKQLSTQESARAAILSSVGSMIGGNAGTLVSTYSAVNSEFLQNELENTRTVLNNTKADIQILLNKLSKVKDDLIKLDIGNDDVKNLLRRYNKQDLLPPA